MSEFKQQDLRGSSFDEVYLNDARFHQVDLSGADFREVYLTGARVQDAVLTDVRISGCDLTGLTIEGVEIEPLLEAELDRRHPDRPKMRPRTADGFREAWAILLRLWAGTVERARTFPAEALHESIDGEWSFIETQRHLVFATDAWVRRALLGDPTPWDPLDLPHDDMADSPPVPRDRTVRPTLDEVLVLRADRQATVTEVLAGLTDEQLAGTTTPVLEPGYPEPESFAVQRCLGAIIHEEWEHRLYAERDLDALEQRSD